LEHRSCAIRDRVGDAFHHNGFVRCEILQIGAFHALHVGAAQSKLVMQKINGECPYFLIVFGRFNDAMKDMKPGSFALFGRKYL
jgi:hypothetical protein